jgi:hypothetical protein
LILWVSLRFSRFKSKKLMTIVQSIGCAQD